MKVILNKDLAPLGEEGDVKDVAKGYARNFLFPRGIALPYTDSTVKLFESRKEEIDARKAEKRKDASGLKEKLEALELVITMPAGANGKLYGAVTGQTIADEFAKQGHQIERKRIELAGTSFKSVGKYKVTVKLYENTTAEIAITVQGHVEETKTPAAAGRGARRRRDEETAAPAPAPVEAAPAPAAAEAAAPPDAPAGESAVEA
ncbi:50S ribosomal protein L9 [Spirochaetia bacterium]|nr:50S ribosomal protein L9 [Spirochaetia bacterium]